MMKAKRHLDKLFIALLCLAATGAFVVRPTTPMPECNGSSPEDWIECIWGVLTLNMPHQTQVDRMAFTRMFIAMDSSADQRVCRSEFLHFWQDCTVMADSDIFVIYDTFKGNNTELVDGDMYRAFSNDDVAAVSRVEFDEQWARVYLPQLPNRGCPNRLTRPVGCPF